MIFVAALLFIQTITMQLGSKMGMDGTEKGGHRRGAISN